MHRGVSVQSSIVVNLYGTNGNDSLTFLNCVGGTGGNSNDGAIFSAGFTLSHGTLFFENVVGGGTSSTNIGVRILSTVAAPAIIGRDILGGPGSASNAGLLVSGATLGGVTTGVISIQAGSLGTGGSNIGIQNAGTILQQ